MPVHRRRGIGSDLVRHAQLEAHRFGVSRLYLYTSTARRLYERLGWEPIAATKYEGEHVTILVSDLGQQHEPVSA